MIRLRSNLLHHFFLNRLAGDFLYNESVSKENEETLEAYEKYADQYLSREKDENAEKQRQEMMKECLAGVSKDAKIFEVGAADGKDAAYFKSLGYENVTVSDATDAFLRVLEEKGFSPLKFNLIEDNFPDDYDFIMCWAVLMHLTKEEAKAAIQKMFNALNDGGKLLTCLKTSELQDEEWKQADFQEEAKLYFSFWSEDELRSFLEEIGFRKIKIWGYESWIDCLAEK